MLLDWGEKIRLQEAPQIEQKMRRRATAKGDTPEGTGTELGSESA
jgi:hypothetical protein